MAAGGRNKALNVERYTPEYRIDTGILAALRGLASQILQNRWQIWMTFKRNFTGNYKGTGLGPMWNFILPLVPITIYVFLAKFRLFPSVDHIDPAVYITCGVTVWFVCSNAVQATMSSVLNDGSIAARTSFPLVGAVVAGYSQIAFETVLRLAATLVVTLFLFGLPSPLSVLFPFILLPPLLLFVGAGIFLAIFNVAYRDVGQVTGIALQYAIFLSCVIFPLPHQYMRFNPFAVTVNEVRHWMLYGQLQHPYEYAAVSVLGLVVFMLAARTLYVAEYRIRGYL